jgi:glycosyltransferase involved in cell wall biosynthesis
LGGVQTFSDRLLRELVKVYETEYGIIESASAMSGRMPSKENGRIYDVKAFKFPTIGQLFDYGKLREYLDGFDVIITSCCQMNLKQVLVNTEKPIIIYTHGIPWSPIPSCHEFIRKKNNIRLCAINGDLIEQAERYGIADKTVFMNNPVCIDCENVIISGESDFNIAVGHLNSRKNYPDILRVNDCIKMPLKIYGAEFDLFVKRLVEDNYYASYMGTVDHKELLKIIPAARFMIHMSFVEGRSIAMLEAMALGTPLITWDIPIYREFVDPEYNVMLNPNGNFLEEFRDKYLPFLDKYLRYEKRKKMSGEIIEKYGIGVFMTKFHDLIKEITGKGNKAA